MHILIVGLLHLNSKQRLNAFKELQCHVTGINTDIQKIPRCAFEFPGKIFSKIFARLGYPLDFAGANQQIENFFKLIHIDVLWIEKGLTIKPATLKKIKKLQHSCQIVSYSPDDMLHPRNQSSYYLAGIPLYDLHVTHKSYNVSELKTLSAHDVIFINKGFDPQIHRPVTLTKKENKRWGAEVGFVGGYENDRYKAMLKLAEAGILVTVRGPGWEPHVRCHPKLIVKPGWVYDDDYARVICATKINLGFLRKCARDLQTARSVEIPACGAFMLAERTNEHQGLFEEGKEAEYFSNESELIEKVRYFLAHDDIRKKIANNARNRCLSSGYSYANRMQAVLNYIQKKTYKKTQ